MNLLLVISFFINALISGFIGLGGGTFYLLFLDLFDVNYILIPFIALLCNASVSGISSGIRVYRKQYESIKFLILILIPSIISTYIGGQFLLREESFKLILSSAIFLITLLSFLLKKRQSKLDLNQNQKMALFLLISFFIGLFSGVIGIGGGVILGPVLHFFGMSYRRIPLITGIYILINSCVGLVSHSIKFIDNSQNSELFKVFSELTTLLKPYAILVFVCLISSIISMYFHKKVQGGKIVKIVAICVVMTIAVYNLFRALFAYFPYSVKV